MQAVRNDNMPTVVWVYETVTMELKAVLGEPTVAAMGSLCRPPPHAVLCRRVCLVDPTVHLNAVRAFKWGPRGTRLAIVTGNSKVRGAAAATAMGRVAVVAQQRRALRSTSGRSQEPPAWW